MLTDRILQDLVDSSREYHLLYTDEELEQLAACETGMGEISPADAKREIRRRAAVKKAAEFLSPY